MCEPPESEQHISIIAPIHMNKAATFSSLYAIVEDVQDKQNTINVTETYCKGLWLLNRAGREVNLNKSLQHELMSVTLSLATTSGILYSANKFSLAGVLT